MARPPSELLPRRVPGGVQFSFAAPSGADVSVAGTFNSWDHRLGRLSWSADETWRITLPLAPGRHLYKYVLGDDDWRRDPANPWCSEDGQGNSCLVVDLEGDVVLRAPDLSARAPGPLHLRHAARASPAWLADAVMYELSISAFGGFAATAAKLPYLRALGVNTLWLMPVHPVGRAQRRGALGDPYAVRDFLAVDPALGTAADLAGLVAAAHGQGFRVLLDVPVNRSAADHPLTREHPEWYTRDERGAVRYAVPGRGEFAGFDLGHPGPRRHLVDALLHWLRLTAADGFRLDDSDLAPRDFLEELGDALRGARPDAVVVSQSYDELHHLAACDLTYEGATRDLVRDIAAGHASAEELARTWQAATYGFPRGALRMRWIEEKEQDRAFRFLGERLHPPAATLLLTLDGVPMILMGQEWNEPRWRGWRCLFEEFRLDWAAFDRPTFAHYQQLLALRAASTALRRGTLEFVPAGAPQAVAFVRAAGREAVLVVVNLSREPVPIPAGFRGAQLLHANAPGAPAPARGEPLPPCGSAVYRL